MSQAGIDDLTDPAEPILDLGNFDDLVSSHDDSDRMAPDPQDKGF
jgi:hypothetical protein